MYKASVYEDLSYGADPWFDSSEKLQELGRNGLKGVVLPHEGMPTEIPRVSSWQELALCAQTDQEAFFPEKGGSARAAKKICDQCVVRQDCLQYALDNDERHGVWGGTSEGDRRRMRKLAR